MDLLPTSEQDEIVSSISAVIAGNHTLGEPLSDDLWQAAVAQGWFALGLDEELGGVGYSLAEEVLLFRELGRACVPGPFLASVLGARVAAIAGDAELAARIVGGEARVGFAQRYDDTRHSVLDGDSAELALVVDGERLSLIAMGDAADVEPLQGFDTLVPVVLARLDGATPLATAEPDTRVALRGSLLVAAMLAGMAQATTEQSVSYGIDREQFGQPVGGFQAVKHRCANMATRAEVANCQVLYAALALRDGRDDAAFHVHAARVVAARAAIDNAQVNVQNHGGIGFTWEHTAHRYVTRSRVLGQCLGTTTTHLGDVLTASAPH
ncbi:MAG: acyl-CoA dehydrogenase family protein [Acidimicrobiales bacterium]